MEIELQRQAKDSKEKRKEEQADLNHILNKEVNKQMLFQQMDIHRIKQELQARERVDKDHAKQFGGPRSPRIEMEHLAGSQQEIKVDEQTTLSANGELAEGEQ